MMEESNKLVTSTPKSFYSNTPKINLSEKRKIYMLKYRSERNDPKNETLAKIFNPRSISLFKNLDLKLLNSTNAVFTIEKNAEGKRTFFIHSYEEIYDLYLSLQIPHIYEVIVENRPCHLYFDVEYHFNEHPEYNGAEMVDKLISLVDEKLFESFGQDEYEIIHLDATSPVKFSRHLIFRSDLFCFRDNRQVATFVHKEILTDPTVKLIVDPAVYSKNRNFRCIWSTKYANEGKYPLVPLDGKNHTQHESTFEYFKKTLITNVGNDPHCIGYPEEQTVRWSCSANNGENQFKILSEADLKCTGIEQFALSVFAPTGMIKSAKYSPTFDTITFIIKGCRLCQRIGREHKSNSIYLVAKLSSGLIAQRCFDPDCRGFESIPAKIPDPILTQLQEQYVHTIPKEYEPVPKKIKEK